MGKGDDKKNIEPRGIRFLYLPNVEREKKKRKFFS